MKITKYLHVGPGGRKCSCCFPAPGSKARLAEFRSAKRRMKNDLDRFEAKCEVDSFLFDLKEAHEEYENRYAAYLDNLFDNMMSDEEYYEDVSRENDDPKEDESPQTWYPNLYTEEDLVRAAVAFERHLKEEAEDYYRDLEADWTYLGSPNDDDDEKLDIEARKEPR